MTDTTTPLVEMRDIRVSFGGIHAVDGVTVSLFPGEVVALVGGLHGDAHQRAGRGLVGIESGVGSRGTGGGEHDASILAFVELAQTGVQIAPQGLDVQIGAQAFEQHGATQTRGAHHRTGRQVLQPGMV